MGNVLLTVDGQERISYLERRKDKRAQLSVVRL